MDLNNSERHLCTHAVINIAPCGTFYINLHTNELNTKTQVAHEQHKLPFFSHHKPQRFLRNGARKRGFAEESGSVCTELSRNKNSFFFCGATWGYLPSQASLLRPSPSLLTNSLCQALPQAAPCNYSLMPQTGEMGVCYTLHAALRKTTVGPLFVNQTQGQNKMLSGTSWVLVIIIENCQAKEHFYWFLYLFIY